MKIGLGRLDCCAQWSVLVTLACACANRTIAAGEGAGAGGTETGPGVGDGGTGPDTDETSPPTTEPPDPPDPDVPPESACGDGILSDDEVCDDGNQVDGDGCNADCQADCVELRSMITFSHEHEGADIVDLALDTDALAVLHGDANGDDAVSLRSLTGALLWDQVVILSPADWLWPAGDIVFVNGDIVATAGGASDSGDIKGWIARLGPTGDLRFAVSFGSAVGPEASVALGGTPEGGVVALGGQWPPNADLTDDALWGVRIDEAGQLEWEMPPTPAGATPVIAGVTRRASVGLDGRVYAFVRDVDMDTSSTSLVALDAGGVALWSREAGWTGWAGDGVEPLDLVATADGGVCTLSWPEYYEAGSVHAAAHHLCLDGNGNERWKTELQWAQKYQQAHWLTQGRMRSSEQIELASVVTPPVQLPYGTDDPIFPPAILVQLHGLDGASLCTQMFMFGDHDTLDVFDIHLGGSTLLVAGLASKDAHSELFVATLELAP